jgi:two-component system cell cycle sensor histidine kinase PleC
LQLSWNPEIERTGVDSCPSQAKKPDLASLPPVASPVKRRLAAQYVRDARDRLTSSSGTRPAFDYELLRLYAQNRLSASLLILLLVATVGFLSSLWTGPVAAGAWTASVLVIHAVIITKCRQFLELPPTEISNSAWRLRFVILDLFYGLAWMFILINPIGVDAGSGTFMLFVMLLVVAVSNMLASRLPMAVFAATFPVTAAIALGFALQGGMRNYILATIAVTALGYFAVFAYRLYSTTLATLEARAEMDALIDELEQAKAISDEARRRAESANILKSRFLAQMSHELRTPLNAVLGFSEVMKTEVFGEHAVPAYKEYSADIHNSGVHLLGLINEIFDLSRIEAGCYEPNEESVSLVGIVEDCHHLRKLRVSNRGITIHEMFEPDLPRLWADKRAIRRPPQPVVQRDQVHPAGRRDLAEVWMDGLWRPTHERHRHGRGHSGSGNPGGACLLRARLELDQVRRTGDRPRAADCQEPDRVARRNFHPEIKAARRHRGRGHIPAGTRGAGDGADGDAVPADRAGARRTHPVARGKGTVEPQAAVPGRHLSGPGRRLRPIVMITSTPAPPMFSCTSRKRSDDGRNALRQNMHARCPLGAMSRLRPHHRRDCPLGQHGRCRACSHHGRATGTSHRIQFRRAPRRDRMTP